MKREQELDILLPVIGVGDVDGLSKAVVWVKPPQAVLLPVWDIGVVVNVKETVWIERSLSVVVMDVDVTFEDMLCSILSASAHSLLIRLIESKM